MANEAAEEPKKSKPSEESESSEKSKSKRWLILLLLLLLLLILIALGVIIFLLLRKSVAEPGKEMLPSDGRATLVVTEDNLDEVEAKLEEPVVAGYYMCSMNVDWHFENASKPSRDAYVANPTDNRYTVYFDVNLEDDSEMLVYSSPYMPVGSELTEIQLTEELKAGTYPAVVTYHLVDEDKKELSTVAVTVTLFIEN